MWIRHRRQLRVRPAQLVRQVRVLEWRRAACRTTKSMSMSMLHSRWTWTDSAVHTVHGRHTVSIDAIKHFRDARQIALGTPLGGSGEVFRLL